MKNIKLFFTLIFIALITMQCSNSSKKNNDYFYIGVIAPKTGVMSGHGNSIEMGAMAAIKIINDSGGILGKTVKLIILDDKSDPTSTSDRTKELIEKYKVKLIIGTGTSATTLAAISPATSNKVPFIYSLDGECKTCSIGDSNKVSHYVWGSGFTERMIVKPYLEYLASKFQKANSQFKVFFIGGDYVYPRTTNEYAITIAKELGFQILGEEYSDMETSDYTPLIRSIMKAKPDLLIVTNPGSAGVTFMRQALQLELDKQMIIGGFATFDQEAIDAMGTASEGVYVINRYSMNLENNENTEFLKVFKSLYPDEKLLPGPTAAAGAYGSLMIAAKAFNAAGNDDPESFYQQMKGLEMKLPQGSVKVNADNNIFDQHVYIMQIKSQQYIVIKDLGMQVHPNFDGCSVK